MKLKEGKITLLFEHENLIIELIDGLSSTHFAKVRLSAKQTMKAFSRLGYCPCEITVRNLDKVGKRMKHKKLEFEIPRDTESREKDAVKLAKAHCPVGWTPDLYFNSQDSFFYKDKKHFAKTTIRRLVEV